MNSKSLSNLQQKYWCRPYLLREPSSSVEQRLVGLMTMTVQLVVLTTKLATDASSVTGAKLHLAANTLCALTVAVIVAFIRSWQLTLLILACVLFPSEANAVQMRAAAGHSYEGQHFLLDCKKRTQQLNKL